ncbi:MAG: hypothetical protein LUF92_16745 [Clostridiales bacterium]|nr:hypothetical protein [Clostridiales bacterium]
MSSQIPSKAPPGIDTKRKTLSSLADLDSLFPTETPESLPVNDHKNTYNLVALMMYPVSVSVRPEKSFLPAGVDSDRSRDRTFDRWDRFAKHKAGHQ